MGCGVLGVQVLTLIPTLMTERGIRKTLARVAFEWSHASYGGEFCLQFEPDLMACVLIYGAAKDLSFEIKHPPGRKWWELCVPGTHVTETKLNDIMQVGNAPGSAVLGISRSQSHTLSALSHSLVCFFLFRVGILSLSLSLSRIPSLAL